MAEFFNRKEEVIDLQLTRHGRYLLSIGKFKPASYSFFDDDVLYDSEYAGLTEIQNNTAGRIKETPRIKQQTTYSGVETEIREINEHIRSLKDESGMPIVDFNNSGKSGNHSNRQQSMAESNAALMFPIGTSEPNRQYKPYWDIKFHKAPLSSSLPMFTGSAEQTRLVPQLNFDHMINTYLQSEGEGMFDTDDADADPNIVNPISIPLISAEDTNAQIVSDIYPDGTYIISDQDYVFADILEKNGGFSRENFEIEVFMIDEKLDGSEDITPLKFFKHDQISMSAPGDIVDLNFPELDPTYVEYWFDIDVDNEINEEILCDIKLEQKKQNLFGDLRIEYDCDEPDKEKTYSKPPIGPDEEIC